MSVPPLEHTHVCGRVCHAVCGGEHYEREREREREEEEEEEEEKSLFKAEEEEVLLTVYNK